MTEEFDLNSIKVEHPMPVARFEQDGQWWRYDPQEDITTIELALLLPTFIYTTRPLNIYGYLEQYDLLRHFVPE